MTGTQNRLENFDLYQMVRKIGDLIFEYATPDHKTDRDHKPWLEDRRNEEANPFYDQSESGLFLELYYGQPSHLHTPWGKCNIGGSGSGQWDDILPKILDRLDATMHQELVRTWLGDIGPVYALHAVDGTPLPEPVELPQEKYASYKEVRTAWKTLTEQWESEQNAARSK